MGGGNAKLKHVNRPAGRAADYARSLTIKLKTLSMALV